MKIKEIRDFKQLPIDKKRKKLQDMKKNYFFMRKCQLIKGTAIAYIALYILGFVKEDNTLYSLCSLPIAFFIALYSQNQTNSKQNVDIIEAETIIKLEDDELTRERTL